MSVTTSLSQLTVDTTGGISVTFGMPAGAEEGKWAILLYATKNGDRTYASGLTGWTLIDNGTAVSADTYLSLWYKKIAASEPDPTVTYSQAGLVNQETRGVIMQLEGADLTTLIDAQSAVKSSFGKQQSINTVTTAEDQTAAFVFFTNDSNEGPMIEQTTSNYTVDFTDGSASSANGNGISIHSKVYPAAGLTDADIFELTNQGLGNETMQSITVAFKSAVSSVNITSTTDPATVGTNSTTIGTGFEAVQGTGSVKQEQGANIETLSIVSWADTSITHTPPDIESTNLKYGESTLRVTADNGDDDILLFDTNPEGDNDYVDLTSLADPEDRLTAIPDLEIGDQVRYETVLSQGGSPTIYTVVVNDDASFSIDGDTPDGDYTFEVRAWDVNDETWGATADQNVTIGEASEGGMISPMISDMISPMTKSMIK